MFRIGTSHTSSFLLYTTVAQILILTLALFAASSSFPYAHAVGKGKPLSKEEKIRKLIRVGVPLVLSGLIVIAAVLFLLKDFTHLYPGRGSHGKTMVTEEGPSPVAASSSATTTTVAHHASAPTSPIDSKCSAHDACGGLTGNCCPTNGKLSCWNEEFCGKKKRLSFSNCVPTHATDGFFLDCCN